MQRWNPYETVLGVDNVGGLKLKWRLLPRPHGGTPISSPAVVNGVVYSVPMTAIVYALNASTGAKLWSYTSGGHVASSPAVVNGVVYWPDDGNVYALNASTGAKLWSYAPALVVNLRPPWRMGWFISARDVMHCAAHARAMELPMTSVESRPQWRMG